MFATPVVRIGEALAGASPNALPRVVKKNVGEKPATIAKRGAICHPTDARGRSRCPAKVPPLASAAPETTAACAQSAD